MAMSQSEREELLKRWIQRSSDSEEERMERAERMITKAIEAHAPFDGHRSSFVIYTKGSYANDTNVRLDSDVDVVVENHAVYYSDYEQVENPQPDPSFTPYTGPWTPAAWREEVTKAVSNYFGSGEVDAAGEVAITVKERPGSRPSADVVPAFDYVRYDDAYRKIKHPGSKVLKKTSGTIINYPKQQLANGKVKERNTSGRYKQFVRALKNAENTLVKEGVADELPSYFMECLIYNVPDHILRGGCSLSDGFRRTLYWLYQNLNDEYVYENWVEPNGLKYLFWRGNKWSLSDAQKLVIRTWNYLGYDVE